MYGMYGKHVLAFIKYLLLQTTLILLNVKIKYFFLKCIY